MESTFAADFSINSDSAATFFGRFSTGGYFVPVPDISDSLNHSLDDVSIDGGCVNTPDPSFLSYDDTPVLHDFPFLESTYEFGLPSKPNVLPFQEAVNNPQSQYAFSTSPSSSLPSLYSSSDFPPGSVPHGDQVISGLKELETSLSEQLAEDIKTCFRKTENPTHERITQYQEEPMSSCYSGNSMSEELPTDPQPTLTQAHTTKPGRKRGRKPSGFSAEEKRKKRLEKGRLAANKCRAKKRKLEVELEFIERQLLEERKQLLQTNESLKREIERLKAEAAKMVGFVNPSNLEGTGVSGNLAGLGR